MFTAARDPEGYAEEVAPAMYAISTYGEGYSIHCRGKPEIRQNMEICIFILRAAADCRVQGRDWTLPGVAHLQTRLAITPAIVTHLPLNISTLVPQDLLQTRLEHPDWQALPQIEDITLEKLNARVPSGWSSHWLCGLVIGCALLLWWKCPAAQLWKLRRALLKEAVKPPTPTTAGAHWIAITRPERAGDQV